MPPHGTAGIFRQKSINSCDRPLSSIGEYARAARQSFGSFGTILSRKMAVTSSQTPSIPWPNSKDEYELGKVIG